MFKFIISLYSGISTKQLLPTGYFTTKLNAGYNFNPYFALEGNYSFLVANQFKSSAYNHISDIAVKGTILLSSVFSLYGKLGMGINYMNWRGTADYSAPNWYCSQNNMFSLIGLTSMGGSFHLSKHFSILLENSLYIPLTNWNNGGLTNSLLMGIQFNF